MKKTYTNPNAELYALHTSDVVTLSGDTIIESDDVRRDAFAGAGDGYERVF